MFGRTEHDQCGGDDELAEAGPGLPEATGDSPLPQHYQPERKLSNAALRRELWRDNQQQSVEDHAEIAKGFLYAPGGGGHHHRPHPELAPGSSPIPGDVFKFDSFDRDRYLTRETRNCDDQHATVATTAQYYYTHHGGGYVPHVGMGAPGKPLSCVHIESTKHI